MDIVPSLAVLLFLFIVALVWFLVRTQSERHLRADLQSRFEDLERRVAALERAARPPVP